MKITILLLVVILSIKANAQSKFIEVNVDDTVIAKADLFIYQINVFSDRERFLELRYQNPNLYKRQIDQNNKKLQKTYDSLVTAFTKAGFTFLSPNVVDKFMITAEGENNNRSAYLMLTSAEMLDSVYKQLQKISDVSGSLIMLKAQNEEPYRTLLSQKLISEATGKAKSLASLSGLSLTGIQSIVEKNNSDEKGGWVAYPPLSAFTNVIPGWHTTVGGRAIPLVTGAGVSTAYVINEAITVRFSVQ